MASTYSTNLGIELMGTGDQSGTWGSTTNTNLGTLLEQAIAGYSTQAVADSASPTVLTIANGASSTGRNAVIALTGALTAARVVEVPAKTKSYIFYNTTTGGFAVTVKVTGQTGVSVPNGTKAIVYCDGTDVRNVLSNIAVDASNGNVGIGTASPGYKLHIVGASAGAGIYTGISNTDATAGSLAGYIGVASGTNNYFVLQQVVGGATGLTNAGAGSLEIRNSQAQPMIFSTTATERMRIDSSGNVGIGTSTPNTSLQVYKAATSAFTGTSPGALLLTDSTNTLNYFTSIDFNTTNAPSVPYARIGMSYTSGGSKLSFGTSNSYASGITNTAMTIDPTGNVGIGTASPTTRLRVVSAINDGISVTDGTVNTIIYNSTTGLSTIGTTSNHGVQFYTNNSFRAMINASGVFLVGTTNAILGSTAASISGVASSGYGPLAMSNPSSPSKTWSTGPDLNGNYVVFNGSSEGAYIAYTGTSWTANSDERLKTDLMPIENAASKVSLLRAVTGRFKTDEVGTRRAFLIAQDVQAVLPEAVDASNPDKLGIQYTEVIPLLVAAIKELSAKNDALEARLAALESK
jgi:hypothetical protein